MQDADPSRVIAVFMREQNGRNAFNGHTRLRGAAPGLLAAQSRIHEDADLVRADEGAITRASAAQHADRQCHAPPRSF